MPEQLNYAAPEVGRRKTHSTLGLLSPLWPAMIFVFLTGVFGKAGSVFLIISPVACAAAVIEAIAKRRRLFLPVVSLATCLCLCSYILYLVLQD